MEIAHIPFREQFNSSKGDSYFWDESKRTYYAKDGEALYCYFGGALECVNVMPEPALFEYLQARNEFEKGALL